jgi:hypothetical protein
MTAPTVDVVIACHDLTRPIERAVRSVLHDDDVRGDVLVTVVAHGIDPEAIRARLEGIDGRWRVLAFEDGVRSAAGPFNHGLSRTEAEYCAVMGSDDFLDPGALSAWVRHVRRFRPDAAIAPIRIDGFTRMPNPLTRLGRSRKLDAARDRLFYRTAPLGLIRTETMRRLGLRMTEGVRVGEDLEFGVRLWSESDRVDLVADAPEYVIGTDAEQRTTLAPMSIDELIEPVVRLLDDGVAGRLSRAHRKSLAIKLIRITVIGHARARSDARQWHSDDEVATLARLLDRLIRLAPGVVAPFSLQDREIVDVLRREPTVDRLCAAAARAASAGRLRRWFPRNPLHTFARESSLRRYVLYWLRRPRKDALT